MEVDLNVKENRLKELEEQIQQQQAQNSSLKQSKQALEQQNKHLASIVEEHNGKICFMASLNAR